MDGRERGSGRSEQPPGPPQDGSGGVGEVARLEGEVARLEHERDRINRFPDQNPNPVLRFDSDGRLLYANPASSPVRRALRVDLGEVAEREVLDRVRAAADDPLRNPMEVEHEGRTYALWPVAIPDFGFLNVYGTDVSAAKLVARFPDLNPNPVIRISEDGRLLYANAASERLTHALASAVGERIDPIVFDAILGALDHLDAPPVEVRSERHVYRLTPVRIPEFHFINLYGTDITALKALDKFPDQNPNPVMRVSPEGRLLYANPASAPLVRTWGTAVGEVVPDALRADVDRCLTADGSRREFELQTEDGIFSVRVASIYEFGFINLYGTDVTAARAIEAAHRENERLLLNILPGPVAERLRRGERVIADRLDDTSLLFADIVGFTQLSSALSPDEVVEVLNDVFSLFDELVDQHGLEKIKTIGDAYMVVGGLPGQPPGHLQRTAEMALELGHAVRRMRVPRDLRFRVGIHAGPVVAGVIGAKKFIYDVWGDTVNTASRMESHGEPGRIQVTEPVYERLRDRYAFQPRGIIDVRGKGPMPTYFLEGREPSGLRPRTEPSAGVTDG